MVDCSVVGDCISEDARGVGSVPLEKLKSFTVQSSRVQVFKYAHEDTHLTEASSGQTRVLESSEIVRLHLMIT